MRYQKHCPGCFVNKAALAVCPNCGYDESAPRSPIFLPHGIVVGGQYRIGRALGQSGGFGITYLAWDVHLQQRVALKEYLPKALCGRNERSLNVVVHERAHEQPFREGLEHFLHEAREIARFDHPNVARVRSFFRANGTACLVTDYYDGTSLSAYLAALPTGKLAPETAVDMLAPVLTGLQLVHGHGVVHRDIRPQNIYLASGGRPILLDFGAARQPRDEDLNSGMAVALSEGYAPPEQYQRDVPQGPATDLYAFAATLYRAVIGSPPPSALDRLTHDALERDLGTGRPAFERVLRRALALRYADRYPSAEVFHRELYAALEMMDQVDQGDGDSLGSGHRRAAVPNNSERAPGMRWAMEPEQGSSPMASHERSGLWSRRGPELIALALLAGLSLIALSLWLTQPGA